MSGKFALIIGNTEYTDPGLAQLTAPGRDAKDFGRVLDSPEIGAFDDVITLVNDNVTKVNEAIDYFFSLKKPDDLLVLYFSGHGVRDEYGSLYLAVKNTNRARLRSTAIKSDFIREAMDQSRSKRQVLILDCCNSGAFAQGTKAEIGGSVGTASAFEGTGYGRVVLTASDSTQFAWEGDKVIGNTDNSLFTHFLIRGLEGEADRNGDGKITIDELYDYAYEQIVNITPKQTPGKWSYKQQGEIVLRQNIRIEDTRPVPLPDDLVAAMNNSLPYIREGAVSQLELLLKGKNLSLARSAHLALERIATEDDSRRVADAAAKALQMTPQAEQKEAQKVEVRPLISSAQTAQVRREKVEAQRKAEEVERLSTQRAGKERTGVQSKTSPKSKKSPPILIGIAAVVLVSICICGYGAMRFLPGMFGGAATATSSGNEASTAIDASVSTRTATLETPKPTLTEKPGSASTPRPTRTNRPASTSTSRPTATWTPRPPSGTCKDGYVYRLINSNDKVCVSPASKAQADDDNEAAESRKILSALLNAYGENACASNYVWRNAYDSDLVCVEPAVRDQVAQDNAAASSRIDIAFSPNCISGYVWRVARESDLVCVTPDVRAQTAADNNQAESRKAVNVYDENECISGYVWREAFHGDLVCVTPEVRQQVLQDNQNASKHTWP